MAVRQTSTSQTRSGCLRTATFSTRSLKLARSNGLLAGLHHSGMYPGDLFTIEHAARLAGAPCLKGIPLSRHFARGGLPMPFHSRLLLLAALALPAFAAADSVAPGSLTTPKGICPLRHTGVQVLIAGPLARVTVTQEFHNPFSEKIEAVYTFPLPPDSAVDDMTMHVGDRTIRGLVKPRDEARKIYEEDRRTGRIAGLLDQERPNIFTQAVANILPGVTVQIRIAYVETVPYEGGAYSFNFPIVVAPRY